MALMSSVAVRVTPTSTLLARSWRASVCCMRRRASLNVISTLSKGTPVVWESDFCRAYVVALHKAVPQVNWALLPDCVSFVVTFTTMVTTMSFASTPFSLAAYAFTRSFFDTLPAKTIVDFTTFFTNAVGALVVGVAVGLPVVGRADGLAVVGRCVGLAEGRAVGEGVMQLQSSPNERHADSE